MAWEVLKITLDRDKTTSNEEVGSLSIIWNRGQADEFIYSGRTAFRNPDLDAFAVKANDARVNEQAKRDREVHTNFINRIETRMNL